MESFVNEILADAAANATSATGGLEEAVIRRLAASWPVIENASVLDKYRMVRALADAAPARTGQPPHDDVAHLIKLRNWLVHNNPRDIGEESPAQLIDHVRGRFPLHPLLDSPGRIAWFPNHALSAGCANWSHTSAHAFVAEFVRDIGSTRRHHLQTYDETP